LLASVIFAMHSFTSLLAILAYLSIVLASPSENVERALPPAKVCKQNGKLVTLLRVHKATAFCSSLLSIAPKTITRTATVTSRLVTTLKVTEKKTVRQTKTILGSTTATSTLVVTTSSAVTK